jgi:thioredoxin
MHVGDADFDAVVLGSSEPVLVDFWAEWCGPCKMIAPALDELADTYAGKARIVKVNVDHNRASAMKYHVRSIPHAAAVQERPDPPPSRSARWASPAEPDARQGAVRACAAEPVRGRPAADAAAPRPGRRTRRRLVSRD